MSDEVWKEAEVVAYYLNQGLKIVDKLRLGWMRDVAASFAALMNQLQVQCVCHYSARVCCAA